MDKISEKFEIDASEEEINGYIAQFAVQQGQRPEKMREQMLRDGSLAQFRLQIRQDKCIAKLLESAKITVKSPEKKAKKTKKAKKATKKTDKPEKKQAKRVKKAKKTTKKKADK